MQINLFPIKTRIVNPPKDEIWDILNTLELQDGDIVFITSKIMAIHQGRCIPIARQQKEALIAAESDYYLPYENRAGFHFNLTITDNTLIPAAGIDASNANDHYIMWPKNIDALCYKFRDYLLKRNNLTRLAVIATDSHSSPLRLGVTGMAIGISGINPLYDMREKYDIFGQKTNITQINIVDPLASMAVLLMGETDEQTPICILRGWDRSEFNETMSMKELKVAPESCIYQPLLDVIINGSVK